MNKSAYGRPLIVDDLKATATQARGLTPVRIEAGGQGAFSERWLQTLISRNPEVLPVDLIEPAFDTLISVCMELPLPSRCYVDNLFVTKDGDLIVGEAKLFRNPEARRTVIGQVMDYAKDISALSYEDLEKAIGKALAPDGSSSHASSKLYGTVAGSVGSQMPPEEKFIDSVTRNLRRGRFLLLVIGDGIQTGTEGITEFLQQHAGMHFTFGLVELAVFALPAPSEGYLVQPRVLAKTVNVERGVVLIEDGKATIKPPRSQNVNAPETGKRTTISEEKFYEELATHLPNVIQPLRTFAGQLQDLGLELDFGKESMILRWRPDDLHALNLGVVTTAGKVLTDYMSSQMAAIGHVEISQEYLQLLASLVPGAHVKETPKASAWYVAKNGTYVMVNELLAQSEGWIAAIQNYMKAAEAVLKDQ